MLHWVEAKAVCIEASTLPDLVQQPSCQVAQVSRPVLRKLGRQMSDTLTFSFFEMYACHLGSAVSGSLQGS